MAYEDVINEEAQDITNQYLQGYKDDIENGNYSFGEHLTDFIDIYMELEEVSDYKEIDIIEHFNISHIDFTAYGEKRKIVMTKLGKDIIKKIKPKYIHDIQMTLEDYEISAKANEEDKNYYISKKDVNDLINSGESPVTDEHRKELIEKYDKEAKKDLKKVQYYKQAIQSIKDYEFPGEFDYSYNDDDDDEYLGFDD